MIMKECPRNTIITLIKKKLISISQVAVCIRHSVGRKSDAIFPNEKYPSAVSGN